MSGHSCDDDARISQLPDDKRRSDCMERERELHEVQHKNERTIAHQRKKSDETLHRQHRQDASAGECGAHLHRQLRAGRFVGCVSLHI